MPASRLFVGAGGGHEEAGANVGCRATADQAFGGVNLPGACLDFGGVRVGLRGLEVEFG